jgi:hypothetical protein
MALGGKEVAPVVQPLRQEVDVDLLPGLEDPSFELMGGGILGDHPVGRRLQTVPGTEVRALADVGIRTRPSPGRKG